MSEGCHRGVPVGKLSSVTMTLWFEPRSKENGEIFGIVTNEKAGEAFRLI